MEHEAMIHENYGHAGKFTCFISLLSFSFVTIKVLVFGGKSEILVIVMV